MRRRLPRGGGWGRRRGMTRIAATAAAAFVLLSWTAPALAQAQDEPAPQEETAPPPVAKQQAIDISGSVELLSDYRFRGISRSGGDPAVQAQLTATLTNGLYAGVRGTTLKRSIGNAELDLYVGYGGTLGPGTSFDAGLIYYAFPGGGSNSGYFEPYASVSHTLGPLEATLGARYAPRQDALGGEDVLYVFGQAEAGVPNTPLTLTAQAGRQDAGAFGSYWNWSIGGRYQLGPIEAGLRYVDTNLAPLPGQDAGLVASLAFRF
jgi:uncharacterized protein (TIGR02001 family)